MSRKNLYVRKQGKTQCSHQNKYLTYFRFKVAADQFSYEATVNYL